MNKGFVKRTREDHPTLLHELGCVHHAQKHGRLIEELREFFFAAISNTT